MAHVFSTAEQQLIRSLLPRPALPRPPLPPPVLVRKRTSTTPEGELYESFRREKESMKNREKQLEDANKRLMKANFTLKEKLEQVEESQRYHHGCAECGSKDSEQNMQLCATCHGLNFVDIENVKKYALCPACAIKKHMRQGHQTVDFFPYLSAFNFSTQVPGIKFCSEELKTARTLTNESLSRFNNLSFNASEIHDYMTDVARRSKSTKHQVETVEKMEMFIDKSKRIHQKIKNQLDELVESLEESLVEMRNWCKESMEYCVDESEVINIDTSEDIDIDPELSFSNNEHFQENKDV